MRETNAQSAPRHHAQGPQADGTPAGTVPPRPDPEGPVETIAQAYLATTHGDAGIALRCAITDALADLLEAERRARANSRLISRGYVRDGASWQGG